MTKTKTIPAGPGLKTPTVNTIKYGELVEYHPGNGGYHTGVKVHFFNKKGVFIGNYYKWIPYEQLRHRHVPSRERVFYGQKFEKSKQFLYETLCDIITYLIRVTQNMSSNGRLTRKKELQDKAIEQAAEGKLVIDSTSRITI